MTPIHQFIRSHSVQHCRAHILGREMKAAFFICLALASSTYATVLVATTTTALTATQAASFYYGVAAVKALALGALGVGALLGSRSRRSVEDVMDQTFDLVRQSEPEQCVHRLICDLATGQLPPSAEDVIMQLFEHTENIPQLSPVFDFAVAAEVGKYVKEVEKCEIQYTCPLTGAQLQKMLVQ